MTSEEYLDSLLKSMEETEVNQSDNPLIKKIITDFEEEQTEDNIENETEQLSQEELSAEEAFFAEAATFEEMFMSEMQDSIQNDEAVKESVFEEISKEDINVEDILAVSVQGALDSWDNLGENNFSTFEDLWN